MRHHLSLVLLCIAVNAVAQTTTGTVHCPSTANQVSTWLNASRSTVGIILKCNQQVTIVQQAGDYTEVVTNSGLHTWIANQFLTTEVAPPARITTPAQIVQSSCPAGTTAITTGYGSYCGPLKSAQCPVGTMVVQTSYGSYCGNSAQTQSSLVPTASALTPTLQPLMPAIPIEPLYGSGPGDLPTDFNLDLRLGYDTRGRMMEGAREEAPSATEQNVFDRLVSAGFREPVQWKLTVVDNSTINASSTAYGQLYLYGGLKQLIAGSAGLTAATLSHEVAHTGLRHQVRTYMLLVQQQRMREYYQARINAGDQNSNYALLAYNIAAPIALRKTERDEEHQADIAGMRIMARAGYHPDYVFALHHLLLLNTGEQSKFAAFFSDHPRWETRDQRSQKEFADALDEFQRYWPDASKSPGGPPPAVFFFGTPTSSENKSAATADITIPLYCRNADGGSYSLVMIFAKDNREVPTSLPEFSDYKGRLQYKGSAECRDKDDASPVKVSLPANAVTADFRKLKATAWIIDGANHSLARSVAFDVHFPKIK